MKDKRDVKGLIKALDYEKDYSVRQAAADALGQMGDTSSVEPLIAALKDSDSDVCKAATDALGRIGDARAAEPLVIVLKDGFYDARHAAADALDKVGWRPCQDEIGATYWVFKREWKKCAEIGALAVVPLITVLKDNDSGVRESAATVLGYVGDARAVEPLIAVLTESDSNVRQAAAESLGQIGDIRAIESLLDALKNRDLRVREAAAGALDKMDWQPGQNDGSAFYWLVKREWKKCAEIGAPAVAPLMAAFKDSDDSVRTEAAEALVIIGRPAAAPLIAELKNSDNSVRTAAAEALVKIGGPAVEPLIVALQDISNSLRMAAAGALVKIGAPAVEPLIVELQKGRVFDKAGLDTLAMYYDVQIISVPYYAAVKEGRVLPGVAESMMRKLLDVKTAVMTLRNSDKNRDARKAAADALGQIGDARAVEPLIAALKDWDSDVCKAAIGALERIGDARARVALSDAQSGAFNMEALKRIENTRI
jgi:HEAT repeat protein